MKNIREGGRVSVRVLRRAKVTGEVRMMCGGRCGTDEVGSVNVGGGGQRYVGVIDK